MRRILIMTGVLAGAAQAHAETQTGFVTWSTEIGAVSDYRWRGVSLTDNNPAIQGGVTASLANGLYVNVWGSTPTSKAGDDEIDFTAGYAFSALGGDADLSIEQYTYPALDNSNYWTLVGLYGHPVGAWTLRAHVEYAPPQRNLWDESVYLALETERPFGETGFTFNASAGWEEGAWTLTGEKWDYAIGIGYARGPASLNLSYVGTDEDAPAGEDDVYGGGVVASLGASF